MRKTINTHTTLLPNVVFMSPLGGGGIKEQQQKQEERNLSVITVA